MIDPEKMHDGMGKVGSFLGSNFVTQKIASLFFNYQSSLLEQKILGINFKNPIGLAAGFDKDAKLTDILPHVGFGFEEAGSVTGEYCAGNPRPRLWRLKKSQALVVYYGLKNEGSEKIAKRLKKKKFSFPLGISIAKTNCRATASKEAGIKDYLKAYEQLKDIGDYITINVSFPNAFGGQPFTDPKDLNDLLEAICAVKNDKPIFLKLPPDLSHAEMDEILKIAEHYKISGFVSSNLTKDRQNKTMMDLIIDKNIPEYGGISGKPVEALANEQIRYLYKNGKGKFIIMGCGGVFSAADAYKKIKLGASLIQLITGMIYEGPQLISEINQGLTELLKKDGYKNISEAIGRDNR